MADCSEDLQRRLAKSRNSKGFAQPLMEKRMLRKLACVALPAVASGLVCCGTDDKRPPLLEGPSLPIIRTANVGRLPGGLSVCSFIIEPPSAIYRAGQQIFFTATQAVGAAGFPIARYDWDFGDGIGRASGRKVSYAYYAARTQVVSSFTTEAATGSQQSCTQPVLVAQ